MLANNARFGDAMVARGYSLVSGGTDNHLLLVDLKPAGIDGARVEVRPRSISPASSGASDVFSLPLARTALGLLAPRRPPVALPRRCSSAPTSRSTRTRCPATSRRSFRAPRPVRGLQPRPSADGAHTPARAHVRVPPTPRASRRDSGGIRGGPPALTSRGLEEAHFDQVAEFIHRGVGIAKEINATAGGKKLADFKAALGAQEHASITALRNDVEAFASQFPCIGFDQETMKYK